MKNTRIHAIALAAALVSTPVLADELSDLKAQLAKLQARLDQLEARTEAAPAATAGDPELPGAFRLPGSNTSIKLGGYVQLDAIHDIRGDEGRWVDLPSASLSDKRKGTTTFSARTSRIELQTLTRTAGGPLRTRIELDFATDEGSETYTNSARPRLRHAYGEYRGWLVGQTWSNFMDVDSLPEVLEFNGPSGQSFIRQAQLRYTLTTGRSSALSLALENPEADVRGDGTALDRTPDLTGRWTASGDWGHFSLSGLLRDLRVQDDTGKHDTNRLGWGLGVGGTLKLGARDTLLYQVNGGKGIGRYIADASQGAAFDAASGKLRAQRAVGGFAGLQHAWSGVLRSSLVYGHTRNFNDEGFGSTADLNRKLDEVFVNLIWSPVEQIDAGVEYVWGRRRTEADQTGEVRRIQASARYKF